MDGIPQLGGRWIPFLQVAGLMLLACHFIRGGKGIMITANVDRCFGVSVFRYFGTEYLFEEILTLRDMTGNI